MIKFGQTQVSLERRELFSNGKPVCIGARAFSILQLLISYGGRTVTRKEIFAHVWPDTVVEFNNLQVHISALRKALGPDRHFIKTITGQGYLLAIENSWTSHAKSLTSFQPNSLINSFTAETYSSNRLTPLIGRSSAVEEMYSVLSNNFILTLVGAGGVGKTVLAEFVSQFFLKKHPETSLFFISLSDISSPDEFYLSLYDFLGLRHENAENIVTKFIEVIRNLELLITIDNCEHLLETIAPFCKRILKECSSVKIFATSREPLRIPMENVITVSGLDYFFAKSKNSTTSRCPAVQLFMERASFINFNFPEDSATLKIIHEICQQLDGIPLAIEQAVQHASIVGLTEFLSILKKNLKVLGHGCRTAHKRHKGLNSSLEWSYNLLTLKEKKFLFIISFFPGQLNFRMIYALVERFEFSLDETTACTAGLVCKSMLNMSSIGYIRLYHLSNTVRYFVLQSYENFGHSFYELHKKHAER